MLPLVPPVAAGLLFVLVSASVAARAPAPAQTGLPLASESASAGPLGGMTRTALTEPARGLVEELAVPAELHQRPGGAPYATFGSVVPIHCCTPEQVEEYANKTHHYCDVFTEQTLAPLGELAYVRIDDTTAEKVFINRAKRLLLVSADGRLAQWRAAPTFESANRFVAGTPIVDKDGALVSVVTARRGNHYAVSTFEGEGGYFDTPSAWTVLETPEGCMVYGDRCFGSRDELRAHVEGVPPAEVRAGLPTRPVLHAGKGAKARVVLVADNGRQIVHHYLQNVLASEVEYL